MNSGNRLWIISDEISISMLTPPKIHTLAGILPSVEMLLLIFSQKKT
jgi:hypothetical protein